MERGLVLRQHFFGADSEEVKQPQSMCQPSGRRVADNAACLSSFVSLSPQVWRACKTVGEMCNLLAMTYLQQGEHHSLLKLVVL